MGCDAEHPSGGVREVLLNYPVWRSGGNGQNTAVNLAKLGERVSLAGVIADDADGRFLEKYARECGVHRTPDCLRWRPQTEWFADLPQNEFACTGYSHVYNRKMDGQSSFEHVVGVNQHLDAKRLRGFASNGGFAGAEWIHVCGLGLLPGALTEGFAEIIASARDQAESDGRSCKISLDCTLVCGESVRGVAWRSEFRHLLRIADCVFLNDDELQQVAPVPSVSLDSAVSASDLDRSYKRRAVVTSARDLFRDLTRPQAQIFVKAGAKGCYFLSEGAGGVEDILVGVDPVGEAADTTGAGDAWAAGFIYARLCGRSTLAAVRVGNQVGRCCVQHQGSTEWQASSSEVQAWIAAASD